MEHINNQSFIHGATHWDESGHASYECSSPNIDLTDYHIYDIEWDKDYIRWHVDGIQYCELLIQNGVGGTEEFQKPFFVLLNLAVGGDWPGSPNGSTIFPANMYVDYVRAYTSGTVGSSTSNSFGANDGWILESTEASNTGGTINSTATTFILGDATQDRQYRAILNFDTSPLPDDVVITSAILQLRKYKINGTDPNDILGSLRVEARKPSFGNPALELQDFSYPRGINIATCDLKSINNWCSCFLNVTGKNYLNRFGTTQFRLYFTKDDNDDLGADFVRFFSGNAGAVSRPRLVIQYYVP